MKTRTAILASGAGSTAEAFIRAELASDGAAETVLVIASRSDAGILQRISNLNQEFGMSIKTVVINSTTHPAAAEETVMPGTQTNAEQQAIIAALRAAQSELVLLLGYMKLVAPAVIAAFPGRILNTHPGLLPATKGTYGLHASEYVLAKHLPEAGQSLHIVSEIYDEGQVIAENKVSIEPTDTPETLFERIQATEKSHLAADIDAFINTL